MHSNWRSALEWRNAGLELTSTSDLACKLYDATVTQMFGFHDDPALGGLEKTMQDMFTADPNFVLGHTLKIVGDLNGGMRNPKCPTLKQEMENLIRLSTDLNVTERERRHVRAAQHLFNGDLDKAADCWELILSDYNTDAVALNHALYSNIFLGRSNRVRDMIAGILPKWNTSTPLYNYVLGMYAFGLEETNHFDKAEELAKQALSLDSKDCWSTHTLAHVYESQGFYEKGINFLTSTVDDWQIGKRLACHNFWHLALFYIEKGDYESALQIYDDQVATRAVSKVPFNLNDSAAFLQRLELCRVDVGDRWKEIFNIYEYHSDYHCLMFNDMHLAMSCLGAKQTKKFNDFKDSLMDFIQHGKGHEHKVIKEVGYSLVESLEAASNGLYSTAVNLLYPIKDRVQEIGGSHAQRDVINQVLIASALRSENKTHNNLAKKLLVERETFKGNCTLRERLELAFAAAH